MSTWYWVGIVATAGMAVMLVGAWRLWRDGPAGDRLLMRRIGRLPLRAKLRLAWAMLGDRRVPLLVRAIPPALVLYLAMPIDIVPDFIPVLGQLDDVLVVLLGVGLLFRFAGRETLEEHVAALEVRAAGAAESKGPGG